MQGGTRSAGYPPQVGAGVLRPYAAASRECAGYPSTGWLPADESFSAAGYGVRWLWMSCRNSSRVIRESRKAPSMQEVSAWLFCFSTPRIIMQK